MLSVDLAEGVPVAEHAVCPEPRGLDRRADGDLLVACADGALQVVPAEGGPTQTLATLGADLRDVIARDGGTIEVSRFRSTTVLTLDASGQQQEVSGPRGGG